ncbi:MAG: radical SAM protein [Candidatus Ancaeobacter aquaticus]|nr:radical SAM protein [Candidatus Ancaeobacter aquaticus]
MKRDCKYIYGPVSSWRLGVSLGVDPVSEKEKICTFDCLYCQLGRTNNYSDKRKSYVSVTEIIKELDSLSTLHVDYITFSGNAEPTLAENLGSMIKAIKKIRNDKIAVITNASLLDRKDVVDDLLLADYVAVKLDACSQPLFAEVNRPMNTIQYDTVFRAILDFKKIYKGKLALQCMFVRENKEYAKEIARIAREIEPAEVQINTPLRPCAARPLSKSEIDTIETYFHGMNVVSVYKAEKKNVTPISNKDTLKRRGKV